MIFHAELGSPGRKSATSTKQLITNKTWRAEVLITEANHFRPSNLGTVPLHPSLTAGDPSDVPYGYCSGVLSEVELASVVEAARAVPPATNAYVDQDMVACLLATVVDFQMHTTAVERALGFFQREGSTAIQTANDLKALLSRYDDDQAGNTALAEWLFGYKLWTRVGLLRSLVAYLESEGIKDLQDLQRWAIRSDFRRDFEGRVRYIANGRTYGLGPAVFNWLVMRLGVETVKPDVRLRRFVERAVDRRVSDAEIVEGVTAAAARLGLTPRQLDWSIWEAGRAQ